MRDGFESLNFLQQLRVTALFQRAGGSGLQRRFEFTLENCQRRLQFVGGVSTEACGLMEAAFKAVEHLIEDGDEPRHLAVVGEERDALVEALRRMRLGSPAVAEDGRPQN